MMNQFSPNPFLVTAILQFVLFLLPSSLGCPTNETLHELCKCESTFNGVLLDCSSGSSIDPIDTPLILRILRENRAQLGLIQELLLRNGTLRQLHSRAFEGLYIKKLDLSQNELENVSSDAFHGLDNVLQILILSKNQLRRFPVSALSNLVALLQLDLSQNFIEDLQETDQLRNTPKLFDLNLADNRICNVHKQVFDDLKQSIQTLNLGGNCFDKVPAAAVRGFKQLLALHLHNNRIEQLEPLQFMNLPSLNLINLARNRIEAVHRQSFLNVPNLRFMYLSDNNITKLEGNEFRTFDNLELLDLTRNHIATIPAEAFVGMPRLSQLYLGENGIRTIEANAFANSSLVILLLPNNELTELRSDMFNGLTYLQQFSLKGNKIARIASNTFYQMPSLVVIDLSDNELTSLEPATFLAQLNLFLLDLSRNKLAATPNNAFNRRIVTVVLQDNPLVCTERVHVLQNGVGVNVPGTVDTICNGGFTTPLVSIAPTTPRAPDLPIAPTVSITDVPAFVQESPSTDTVLIIQQHTPAPTSSPSASPTARPLTVLNGQTHPGSSPVSETNRFLLSTLAVTVFPPFAGVDPNGSNSGVGNPRFGGLPVTSPNLGNPNSGVPFDVSPNPVPNLGPAANPNFFVPNFGSISSPHIGSGVNGASPSNTFNISNASADQFVPPNLLGAEPDNSRPPIITANGKIDNRTPFGLTPQLTVVSSNSGRPISPNASRPPVSPSFVPGIVEQVPLENEGQGGVVGTGNRLPGPTAPPSGAAEPSENDNFDGQEFAQGQTPKFAWTWPVSSRFGPSQSVFTQAIPVEPFPIGPTPSRSAPFALSPPTPTAALPPDAITAALPAWTNLQYPNQPGIQRPSSSPTYRPIRPWQGESDWSSFTPPSPEPKTVPPKKHRPDEEIGGSDAAAAAGEFDASNTSSSGANATTTIAVCLTVVVVVMISVFVTLCVVRHRTTRNNSRQSISSASRTSAYVAAQAARINYAASTYGVVGPCSSSLGTGAYMGDASCGNGRGGTGGTLQRGASTATNHQAWIYAPGTYASPSTYYK